MLLKKLKDLLGSESTATGEVEDRALELACAALMFEVARADFSVETTEQDAVTSLLTAQFNLRADEVSTITEAAVDQAERGLHEGDVQLRPVLVLADLARVVEADPPVRVGVAAHPALLP